MSFKTCKRCGETYKTNIKNSSYCKICKKTAGSSSKRIYNYVDWFKDQFI